MDIDNYAELGRIADRIIPIPCGSLMKRKGKSKYCVLYNCRYVDFCKKKIDIIKSEGDNGRRKKRCGREV